ncbi:MAG: hypothetical protein ACXVJJ_06160 [Halobacteriota archaeon]
MKCGVCCTTLVNEAEERFNGDPDLWVCKRCYMARELEPYDKPETEAEKELHDKLFAGKKYFRPLSEEVDAILADLRAQLEVIKNRPKEPRA